MTEHTVEPWSVRSNKRTLEIVAKPSTVEFPVARIRSQSDIDLANAARIVACVNACEGVSTDNLRPGDMREMILDLDEMRRQRDALLTACQRLCDDGPTPAALGELARTIRRVESKEQSQ